MAFLSSSSSVRRWWRAGRWGLVWLCALAGFALRAAEPPPGEYQVKAVFLFNFAQFAEWPQRAFTDAKAPIVIGVLGENPFGTYLDDLLKDEKVGGRPLAVRYCRTVDEAIGTHIIFVGRSEAAQFEPILAKFKGKPILTISDTETFIRAGGMVRFGTEAGKVRLWINIDEAKANGVTISSKIVRLATLVTRERN